MLQNLPRMLGGMVVGFLLTAGAAAGADLSAAAPNLTDMSLEQLMDIEVDTVYGASRYEQKTSQAPAAVTIITAGEIARFGYRTLADLLRGVRGFYVTYDRTYNYLGVRGFNRPGDYNSRVLLLVDGHRMNDNIYDQAAIGHDFILDVDLIDRVEIIRGPSSSLYGASAFLGVVNVITRQGKDMNGVEVAGSGGSQDTYEGRLSFGKKYGSGIELLLSGSAFTSNGNRRLFFPELDTPEDNNGVSEKRDGDSAYRFLTKVAFGDLSLTGAYVTRKKETPTGSFLTLLNDPGNSISDRRGFLSLDYQRKIADNGEVTARVGYNYYGYRGIYMYAGDPGAPPFRSVDTSRGDELLAEVQYNGRVTESHHLTLGLDYRYNLRQDQTYVPEDPAEIPVDLHNSSSVVATYLQDEWQVMDDLVFNAGFRYDHYTTFGGTLNPRVALIYSPFETTTFKALYGRAFRAPNVFELYYQDLNKKPNPDLKPETISTYELLWEQGVGDHVRTTLSGFYYKASDLINQESLSADTYRLANTSQVEARGGEAEVAARWNGIQGRASYTFEEVYDLEAGSTLSNSPRHLAKVNLTVPVVGRKVFTSPELQYVGPRRTSNGLTAGGFVITNLTLFSTSLLPGLSVSASIYNLFDVIHADPVSADFRQETIAQDGRTFRVKLTWLF